MKEPLKLFSTEVQESEISTIFSKNYHAIQTEYLELQRDWLNRAYVQFEDFDKYMILISLISKTFSAYADYFLKYNWDEFYDRKEYELKKFSIVDIASQLYISKETARRKILELEKIGLLKKTKKNLTIQRNAYQVQKPIKSIRNMAKLMSTFSKKLFDAKIIKNHIPTELFTDLIKNNYTQCWNFFLQFQIEVLTDFKKTFFKDYESLSVWTMIVYNHNLSLNKKIKGDKNYTEFLDKSTDEKENFSKALLGLTGSFGLNAMTISDLTGIPRPTVIRKLRRLVKEKFITRDESGLYKINAVSVPVGNVDNMRLKNAHRLSAMVCKFFNAVRLSV